MTPPFEEGAVQTIVTPPVAPSMLVVAVGT